LPAFVVILASMVYPGVKIVPSKFHDEVVRQIERNKTFSIGLLLAALANAAVGAVAVGSLAGPGMGLLLFLGIIAWVAVAFLVFESLVMSSTRSRPPTPAEEQRLRPLIARIAYQMNLAPPRLMVMEDAAANAFAIGSNPAKASVTFTTGLLARLDAAELEGVIAHELSHIANQDSRVSALSVALLGWALIVSAIGTIVAIAIGLWGIGMLTNSGSGKDWSAVLAGICVAIVMICVAVTIWVVSQTWFLIAQIAHLGFSRQREWLADTTAISITNRPLALASALEKIARTDSTLTKGRLLAQSLCLAGAPRKGNWWSDLLDTHPDIWKRIERLRSY
jgi:heat shock protein HtpX